MSKLRQSRKKRPCTVLDAANDLSGPCPASAAYRCDFPGCEAVMCPRHAKLVRFGVHHCPKHATS